MISKVRATKFKISLSELIMFVRTFLRVMFNSIFCDNVVIAFARRCVNLCNNSSSIFTNPLKFSEKMPLDKLDTNTKISFRSITGDEIDCNNIKIC